MKVLTSSSLSTFRGCPRQYFYAYELKRAPVAEAPALAFGKLWHTALEAWWRCGTDRLSSAVIALKEHAEETKPEDAAKIIALLEYYNPPKHLFDVIGVEAPFEVKIENPSGNGRAFYGYRLAGKIDLLLKHRETGETWICDHKHTTSEILGFGIYWQALQVDGQMANYCLAWNARGFIYDVARKPQIKMCGKDEKAAKERGISVESAYQARLSAAIGTEPGAWFEWRSHLKDEGDMREARLDLWQQAEMFRSCNNAGRFPRNSNHCVNRYGTCPYINVCTGRASLDDDTLFRSKEEEHEEI